MSSVSVTVLVALLWVAIAGLSAILFWRRNEFADLFASENEASIETLLEERLSSLEFKLRLKHAKELRQFETKIRQQYAADLKQLEERQRAKMKELREQNEQESQAEASTVIPRQQARRLGGLGELPDDSTNGTAQQTFEIDVNFAEFLKMQGTVNELQRALMCVGDASSATDLYFVGCNVHIQNGMGKTMDNNALGNLIVGYSEQNNCVKGLCARTGSHNLVVGMNNDWTAAGGIVAGEANLIAAQLATVTGGYNNIAQGITSSISGGRGNFALEEDCIVVGGEQNNCTGVRSVVAGGVFNVASGRASAVLSGLKNIARGDDAAVIAGALNDAAGMYSTVSSGRSNMAGGLGAHVVGGSSNEANGTQSVIVGGTRVVLNDYNGVAAELKTPAPTFMHTASGQPSATPSQSPVKLPP